MGLARLKHHKDNLDYSLQIFDDLSVPEPKPAEPEPNRQIYSLGHAGKLWMIRQFTSARLFPHQQVQRVRTLCVQAITASLALHHKFSIATDFFAESVKS